MIDTVGDAFAMTHTQPLTSAGDHVQLTIRIYFVLLFACCVSVPTHANTKLNLPVLGVLLDVKVLENSVTCVYNAGGISQEIQITGLSKCPKTFSF